MAINHRRLWQIVAVVICCAAANQATFAAPDGQSPAAAQRTDKEKAAAQAYTTESLRGRIVWMAEALKRRFGIESDLDAAETVIALETGDGRLYQIVKDARGRGFWLDPRLRGIDVELVVRRYEGSPAVQIVRWYKLRDGRKYELDYWCDICAIPMYELKSCDCCQGETRLRERLPEESAP